MAIKITKGSPNIFRDLGFSPVEAQHLRVRAELMLALERLIARRRLTQGRAAKLLGVSQPRVHRYLATCLHKRNQQVLWCRSQPSAQRAGRAVRPRALPAQS